MVLKFLHLQSHFIHLYFFTLFEVLFYIYYILPYEKSIFKHIFDDEISSIPKINISSSPPSPYFSINKCNIYQNNLDNDNKYIYDYCFIYIYSISSIFIIMFFRDIWKNYYNYNTNTTTKTPTLTLPLPSPKYDSKSSIISFGSFQNLKDYKKNDDKESYISMIEIPKNNNENKNNNNINIENQTFIIYYWNNSGFISELIKTIEFIIFVGIFEYIFFVYIVNKFKIANSKTIFCNIYKKITN